MATLRTAMKRTAMRHRAPEGDLLLVTLLWAGVQLTVAVVLAGLALFSGPGGP